MGLPCGRKDALGNHLLQPPELGVVDADRVQMFDRVVEILSARAGVPDRSRQNVGRLGALTACLPLTLDRRSTARFCKETEALDLYNK